MIHQQLLTQSVRNEVAVVQMWSLPTLQLQHELLLYLDIIDYRRIVSLSTLSTRNISLSMSCFIWWECQLESVLSFMMFMGVNFFICTVNIILFVDILQHISFFVLQSYMSLFRNININYSSTKKITKSTHQEVKLCQLLKLISNG